MTMAMTAVLLAAELLLLLPVLLFALEVTAAALTRRSWQEPTGVPEHAPATVVLVPAHNEGTGLLPLLTGLPAAIRTLVVADNCTDGTAAIARATGAEVIERHDRIRRGKGFALDFGLAHLAQSPPEVVVIIDADCRVAPAAIARLAALSAHTNRPVQSAYTMHPADAADRAQRIAEFAWDLNTYVRSLGLARCGWPARLAGTGMAIPWTALTKINLATGNVVEDLALGLDLSEAGYPPLFCPTVTVESAFPASVRGMRTQRQRWELGALRMAFAEAPPRLWRGLRLGNAGLLVLALDLMIPPLVLLLACTSALSCFGLLATAFSAGWLLFLLPAAQFVLVASTITLAFARFGRDGVRASDLGELLSFVLGKVEIYRTGFAAIRIWVRTDRT